MSRARDEAARTALRELRVPGESQAEERSWAVVREAFAERAPVPPQRSVRARVALAAIGAAAVGAFALTPAGADVRDWIADTITGEESAQPVLESLPAPGAVLTESRDGAWILRDDGSRRRLGDYDRATWSPNGLFVGASAGSELVALNPQGVVQWSQPTPAPVESIDWSADEGFRVAFVSGSRLFVLPGDKSEPPTQIGPVGSPAIAWQPESSSTAIHRLAYVNARGHLTLRDTDSGIVLWRSPELAYPPDALQWSEDGERLLVLQAGSVLIFDADGANLVKGPIATGVTAAAIAPDGESVAVVRPGRAGGAELALVPVRPQAGAGRVLYESGVPDTRVRFGAPVFSPDGRWILLPWPQPDQWLFVPVGGGRTEAVADVSRQLDPDRRGNASFPRVAGWCC